MFRIGEVDTATCYDKLDCNYIRAVEKSGGIPLPIPLLSDINKIEYYLELIDGLLLTGGKDIAPSCYREEPIEETSTCKLQRDRWELELFKKAYEQDLPVLGICRGLQVMNVALGGTLYQDIIKQYGQTQTHLSDEEDQYARHCVELEKGSKLFDILCTIDQLEVNSYHHQAIKDLAPQFKVSAQTEGIIEAIEAPEKRFIIGVQWHPERIFADNKCFEYLFSNLITAASEDTPLKTANNKYK